MAVGAGRLLGRRRRLLERDDERRRVEAKQGRPLEHVHSDVDALRSLLLEQPGSRQAGETAADDGDLAWRVGRGHLRGRGAKGEGGRGGSELGGKVEASWSTTRKPRRAAKGERKGWLGIRQATLELNRERVGEVGLTVPDEERCEVTEARLVDVEGRAWANLG